MDIWVRKDILEEKRRGIGSRKRKKRREGERRNDLMVRK